MPINKRDKKAEDIVKDILPLPPPLRPKKTRKQKRIDEAIYNKKGGLWRPT
jgi:hypothetical protein